MFRGPVDPVSDLIYFLVVAGLWVAWALLYLLAIAIVMLVGHQGFQDAAVRVQTWGGRTREIAARTLKITAAAVLGALIIYIGIKVFTS